jgi:murein DD-endopeptidase MepM/ murein hydrolase activator NlpD
MSNRYRAKLVLKLFPSIPRGVFGSARLTGLLERHLFYREFELAPRQVTLALAVVVGLAFWGFTAVVLSLASMARVEGVREEIALREVQVGERERALAAARRDYYVLLSRLQPLDEKVGELSAFASKLAMVAGVEHLGRELGEAERDGAPDLALSTAQVAELDRRFARIGSFVDSQELVLSHTPSISPLKDSFVPTDRFGYRVSRFTRQASVEGRGGGDRQFHAGLDLAAPVGTPIHATADGTVHFAGHVPPKQNPRAALYGNFVVLDHGNGIRTVYGHCDQLAVSAGDEVRRGDVIAWVGSTGRSTGPHVHYEVVVNGRPLDPELFVLDVTIPERRVRVSFDEGSLLVDEVDRLLGN